MDDRAATPAWIGVGSNLDPLTHIPAALAMVSARCRVTAISTHYRTEPLAGRHQPAYVNGVWRIEVSCKPYELAEEVLGGVEDALGRTRTGDPYASRTIDLDLLIFGDRVADEPGLRLPHPDLSRPFVHVPLLELDPDLPREAPEPLRRRLAKLLPETIDPSAAGEPMGELTMQLRRAVRATL
jgi:2-amino-4-hydroxy-6-hydroxymethyldihydropteridine diphosphokinase